MADDVLAVGGKRQVWIIDSWVFSGSAKMRRRVADFRLRVSLRMKLMFSLTQAVAQITPSHVLKNNVLIRQLQNLPVSLRCTRKGSIKFLSSIGGQGCIVLFPCPFACLWHYLHGCTTGELSAGSKEWG